MQRIKTLFLLALLLTSCVPAAASMQAPTSPPPTPFFTVTPSPVPASTLAPTRPPRPTRPAPTLDPNPPITLYGVFLYGMTSPAEKSGTILNENSFLTLYETEHRFTSLRFILELNQSLVHIYTLPQIVSRTAGWRMEIHRHRTDGNYAGQPSILLDDFEAETGLVAHYLITDVDREALQARFGDCRAFASRILDEHGKPIWQGYFVLNPTAGLFNNERVRAAVREGVLVGLPYSYQAEETAFFHQEGGILIHEPPGGFYRLYYTFDFSLATGIYGTFAAEAAARELALYFLPYRSDGQYNPQASLPTVGQIISTAGYYTVDLPIAPLLANGENKYILRIVNGEGNILKEEYFIFIPSPP